jgi:hypothetical protein
MDTEIMILRGAHLTPPLAHQYCGRFSLITNVDADQLCVARSDIQHDTIVIPEEQRGTKYGHQPQHSGSRRCDGIPASST